MVEDVGTGAEDRFQRGALTPEVGHEDLHARAGPAPPDGPYGGRKVRRAAVVQVVAGDGGEDDVTQAEPSRRLRDAVRLAGIRRLRPGRGHRAVSAPPRAAIAEEHEGGGAAREAIPQVGAARLLADGIEPLLAQEHPDGARRRRERAALPRPPG